MKTIRQSLLIAAFAAAASVPAHAEIKNDLTKPEGTLSATPERVARGTFPKLSWSIDYPGRNEDSPTKPTSDLELQGLALLVTYNTDNTKTKNNNGHGNNIDGVDGSNPGAGKGHLPQGNRVDGSDTNLMDDDERKASTTSTSGSAAGTPIAISAYDTVTAKGDIKADVHVIGGYNKIDETTYGKLSAGYKTSSGSWTSVISNLTQIQIDPSKTYVSIDLPANATIDFKAQGETKDGLSAWRETGSGAANPENVVALVDGATPPSSAFSNGMVRDYLKPYLDDKGKINIGPRDVLYLFEVVKSAN